MNKGIKALWIDALRSGEYEQGTGFLRKEGTGDGGRGEFCCLGVLCDLYVESEENYVDPQGPVEWEALTLQGATYARRIEDHLSFLPDSVMEWAGLTDNEGSYARSDGGWSSLVEMNDNGYTFDEIADVIEEKF